MSRIRAYLGGLVLVAAAAVVAPMAAAQTQLDAYTRAELLRAARIGSPYYLESTVLVAVARNPAQRDAILAEVVRLAPQWAERIAFAVTGAPPPRIEPRSPPRAKPARRERNPWSGTFEIGGSLSSGNTDTQVLSMVLSVKKNHSRWQTDLKADFQFVRDDSRTTTQRILADASGRYSVTRRGFVFGYLQYEDDRFNGFDYRVTENAGLGYRFIDAKTLKLKAEAGPGARQGKVKLTGKTESELIGRFNAELEWKISPTATLLWDASAISGRQRTTANSTLALTMPIVGRVAGKLSFNLRHNTKAPMGAKRTDTLTKASITLGF